MSRCRRGVWGTEKLIGKLKDFIAKVKAYFDGLTTNTKAEAALLKEMRDGGLHYLECIVDAYDKAATAAVENYQGAETRSEGGENQYMAGGHGGKNDGNAEQIGRYAYPQPFAAAQPCAVVISQRQRDGVEHMDGREHVGGRIRAPQSAYRAGKDIIAVNVSGTQVGTIGYDCAEQQREGHAGKQRQAQPPEFPPVIEPQQIEQCTGDPGEPQVIRDDGVFTERNQIIQPAVEHQIRHLDALFQQFEKRKIKDQVAGHELDGMVFAPCTNHKKHSFLRKKAAAGGPFPLR